MDRRLRVGVSWKMRFEAHRDALQGKERRPLEIDGRLHEHFCQGSQPDWAETRRSPKTRTGFGRARSLDRKRDRARPDSRTTVYALQS